MSLKELRVTGALISLLLLSACADPVPAPVYVATASSALGAATAQAQVNDASLLQTQQARQDESDALRLEQARQAATVQAEQAQATLLALTPTATHTWTPSPVPTETPRPTWTPTPDATATARADLMANTATYGGMGFVVILGIILLAGVVVIIGAVSNRIEAQAKALQTKAAAEADAIRWRARAEAERLRHWQVQDNIVSTGRAGIVITPMRGAEPAQEMLPMPTFRRMMDGGRRVDDIIKLGPLEQQAVEYLRECAAKVGWGAQRLPAAGETGDNSQRQPVVDALKAAGRLYTQRGRRGGGTYLVGEYQTIQALHDALVAGELKF